MIFSISLGYGDRLTESGCSAVVFQCSRYPAHHIIFKLNDRRTAVTKQHIGCSVVFCKDGRIDNLSHVDACCLTFFNSQQRSFFYGVRTCRAVCYSYTNRFCISIVSAEVEIISSVFLFNGRCPCVAACPRYRCNFHTFFIFVAFGCFQIQDDTFVFPVHKVCG